MNFINLIEKTSEHLQRIEQASLDYTNDLKKNLERWGMLKLQMLSGIDDDLSDLLQDFFTFVVYCVTICFILHFSV